MTRVKICGIRTLRDALIATESGADFIGLVFVPNRRRRVEAHTAEAIVEGVRKSGGTAPKMVGLFADQPQADVNRTIKACGLDLAQLCGSESLDYCNRVQAQVIKVLHVSAVPDGPVSPEPLDGPGRFPGVLPAVRTRTMRVSKSSPACLTRFNATGMPATWLRWIAR